MQEIRQGSLPCELACSNRTKQNTQVLGLSKPTPCLPTSLHQVISSWRLKIRTELLPCGAPNDATLRNSGSLNADNLLHSLQTRYSDLSSTPSLRMHCQQGDIVLLVGDPRTPDPVFGKFGLRVRPIQRHEHPVEGLGPITLLPGASPYVHAILSIYMHVVDFVSHSAVQERAGPEGIGAEDIGAEASKRFHLVKVACRIKVESFELGNFSRICHGFH